MQHTRKQEFMHLGFMVFVMCLLGSIFPALLHSTYRGSPDLHSTIEMVGSLFGVLAGIVLVVHFYVLGNRFYLLVGLAYFVNGAEDFVHGLNQFHNIFDLSPAQLALSIPVTYTSGRIMMGIILLFAPFAVTWFGESRNPKHETIWASLTAIFLSLILTAVAFDLHLPKTIQPEAVISRPVDFLSAIVLCAALIAFVRKYHHDRTTLTWWISFSIGVNMIGQLMMSFSKAFNDPFFDIAHVYKVLGYLIPVLGFSLSQIEIITQNKRVAEELNTANQQLRNSMQKERDLAAATAAAAAEKKRAEELNTLNQQLHANEQQLKTVNQQLQISEQQQRAANQQLAAKEQALQKSQTELTDKMDQVERFNKIMVGREMDMIKLKEEINSLLIEMGKPPKYGS